MGEGLGHSAGLLQTTWPGVGASVPRGQACGPSHTLQAETNLSLQCLGDVGLGRHQPGAVSSPRGQHRCGRERDTQQKGFRRSDLGAGRFSPSVDPCQAPAPCRVLGAGLAGKSQEPPEETSALQLARSREPGFASPGTDRGAVRVPESASGRGSGGTRDSGPRGPQARHRVPASLRRVAYRWQW